MHSEILRLIETADPDDATRLDEIDARVWCYIKGYKYHRHDKPDQRNFMYEIPPQRGLIFGSIYADGKLYTRSRDALKSIRPDTGFISVVGSKMTGYLSTLWDAAKYPNQDKDGYYFSSTDLATEELAELHCLVQFYAYIKGGNYKS